MSIDLTAAIEAARDEMDDWETFLDTDGDLSIGMKDRKRTAAEVVARIAPLIEQAVREQVARDIEQSARLMDDRIEDYVPEFQLRIKGNVDGRLLAACIARRTL